MEESDDGEWIKVEEYNELQDHYMNVFREHILETFSDILFYKGMTYFLLFTNALLLLFKFI